MPQTQALNALVLCGFVGLSCGGATVPATGSATGGGSSMGGSSQGGMSMGGSSLFTTHTAITSAASGGNSTITPSAVPTSGSGGATATNLPSTGASGAVPSGGGGGGTGGTGPAWPAFEPPTSGALIPSLSTGFETGIGAWKSFRGLSSGVTRVSDASTGEGSSYLTYEGAQRIAGWDGPAIDILPQISPGRTYELTAAVRFSPGNLVTAPSWIGVAVATHCNGSAGAAAHSPLASVTTGSEWARLRGSFVFTLPPDCAMVTKVLVYFETLDAMTSYSLDVDDFQVWDVSPRGGAGGASNQGAAGSTGVGG